MNEEKVDVPTSGGVLELPKRRKGRPPKNLSTAHHGDNSSMLQKTDRRARKPRRKNVDVSLPAVDSTFIGQQVHGVLDGSFDAGYFLTVRVGNSQTVLRGAVFEPSLAAPVSNANDIAPDVRFIDRTEQLHPALPQPVGTATPAVLSSAAPSAVQSPAVPPVHGDNLALPQHASYNENHARSLSSNSTGCVLQPPVAVSKSAEPMPGVPGIAESLPSVPGIITRPNNGSSLVAGTNAVSGPHNNLTGAPFSGDFELQQRSGASTALPLQTSQALE